MTEARCPRCATWYRPERAGACPGCLCDAELAPAVIAATIELLDEVSRDGLGIVYQARHLRLKRIVAARLLTRPPGTGPRLGAGLAQTVRALAKLRHPRIIQVYDLVEEGDEAYLVTEHVQGPQLSRALPLPAGQAIAAALDICDALAFAHGRGIVHGALTAEDIWFDARGRAMVVGLGLASVSGKVPATDPQMDIHALGVILHQAVGGRGDSAINLLPAPRQTSAEVLRAELVAAREALGGGP